MPLLDRRTFARGGVAISIMAALVRDAVASTTHGGCGCCGRGGLSAPAAVRPWSSARDAAPGGSPDPALTSGDAATDGLLGLALVGLAELFKVNPGFVFYDDADSPNARATDETVIPGTWGTVAMGRGFFGDTMRLGDKGLSLIAVCAHEFGHIHQMRRGYQKGLLRRDTTVRPIELHADFLAGYFLASRKKEHPDLDLFTVGETFSTLGDVDVRGRGHHGTPVERTAAITAGYDLFNGGERDIERVAEAGVDYVAKVL